MTTDVPMREERAQAADQDADPDGATSRDAGDDRPVSAAEYSVAFTPRNVAIGLAIVAGLVAIALRRRRGADVAADED
jgi:hypothetical protein